VELDLIVEELLCDITKVLPAFGVDPLDLGGGDVEDSFASREGFLVMARIIMGR
jgi:hypothetical protein